MVNFWYNIQKQTEKQYGIFANKYGILDKCIISKQKRNAGNEYRFIPASSLRAPVVMRGKNGEEHQVLQETNGNMLVFMLTCVFMLLQVDEGGVKLVKVNLF